MQNGEPAQQLTTNFGNKLHLLLHEIFMLPLSCDACDKAKHHLYILYISLL